MAEYAITIGVANLFREPDINSDLVTQLEVNANVAVVEHNCLWSKIVKDSYEGFCKTELLKFENNNATTEKQSNIVINIPRDCACALYNALKFSLKI